MYIAPMQELKEHLSALAEKAASGEIVEITKHNKPFIRLMPAAEPAMRTGRFVGKKSLKSVVSKNTGGAFLALLQADRG